MHIECTRLIVLAVSPSIQEVTSSLRNLVTYSNVAVLYYAIMLEKRAECDKQKGAKFFPFKKNREEERVQEKISCRQRTLSVQRIHIF